MIKKLVIFLMALFIVAMIALSFYGNANAVDGKLKLLMVHSKTCHYCIAFMDEVGDNYEEEKEAFMPPLVIINARDLPSWFREALNQNRIKPIRGTPTFILWNGRIEMERIVGYGGKEQFYNTLRGKYAEKN